MADKQTAPPPLSASTAAPSESERQAAVDTLYQHGLRVRREVAGDKYVDRALSASAAGRISAPAQEYITAACWGGCWARDADDILSRRDRSLLNLAMLCCLNRATELATHIRAALTNGVTEAEIGEVMLQVCVYAGAPAGLEGCRVAEQAIQQWHDERKE